MCHGNNAAKVAQEKPSLEPVRVPGKLRRLQLLLGKFEDRDRKLTIFVGTRRPKFRNDYSGGLPIGTNRS